MKIYTKSGDTGETGLFGGARVSKDDVRVEAYGAVDELNAALGVARAHGAGALDPLLSTLQGRLFTVGSELATPPDTPARTRTGSSAPSVFPAWTRELEEAIDQQESALPPLRHFLLPAGAPLAAALHLARTVCRRAERRVVTLHQRGGAEAEVLVFLNRLSDFLFVAARTANRQAGVEESVWDPHHRG